MAKKSPIQSIIASLTKTDWIVNNLGFVGFLAILALMYIFNAHYSEKKVRQIQAMEKEIKELRWQYTSLRAQVMFNSMQSEIAKEVEGIGLKNKDATVKKILVSR